MFAIHPKPAPHHPWEEGHADPADRAVGVELQLIELHADAASPEARELLDELARLDEECAHRTF
jgi:hypothetical protein